MQPLDFADKNRAVATTVLKATFGMAMAWLGAFVSLLVVLSTLYNIVPEDPSSAGIAIWLLPMLLWASAAMCAGGTFAGLSLAPKQIWKPLLLITVAVSMFLFVMLCMVTDDKKAPGEYFAWLVFCLVITAIPNFFIALFVATNNRKRMRLQFGLTLAGIIVMAATWLALSLALPGAMRDSIAELAGDQPYRLYVPDPSSEYQYRKFAGPPDFWTFQSIFTAKRMLQAHMCLYVGAEGSPRKAYHWSFFSGFRFLKNPENAVWC